MLSDEFRARRNRVLEAIHPGVLVVFSAPVALRNNDVEHEYRQSSDFFYLTGFDEPESVLVLSNVDAPKTTLLVRPRDPDRETWDGPRAGLEGALSTFGADEAFAVAELDTRLPDLLRGAPRLFYELGQQRADDDRVLRALAQLRRRTRQALVYPSSIHEPAPIVHEMRLRKSASEIQKLSRALQITGQAHAELMRETRPGMFEYELEAKLRRAFRESGAERTAYAPIVGSGPNATILHHIRNNRRIEAGDLVLVDAGCEYDYYAADVTRTYPASGRFSAEQREIYSIVLDAQLAAIEHSRMGATLEDVHQAALGVIVDGLIRLGLIEGPRDVAISEGRYKPYFMHRTSHWLGMDVHDVGRYYHATGPRELEPGMVLTVEPGIYIAADGAAEPRYRGIGVRIEDDVLISEHGPVVLSSGIPKSIDEVELACAR